jgi:hypothetical protein
MAPNARESRFPRQEEEKKRETEAEELGLYASFWSYAYKGVGEWACSASFRKGFFSETRLPA